VAIGQWQGIVSGDFRLSVQLFKWGMTSRAYFFYKPLKRYLKKVLNQICRRGILTSRILVNRLSISVPLTGGPNLNKCFVFKNCNIQYRYIIFFSFGIKSQLMRLLTLTISIRLLQDATEDCGGFLHR
jgi:hypothetical protein